MKSKCAEPTLGDTLSDPVIQAMMTADGIEFHEFEAFLREMAQKVGPARDPSRPQARAELVR